MANSEQQKKAFDKEQKPLVKEKAEQEKLAVLEAEKKDLVDSLQRLQAEFENYKKRVEKEKAFCLQSGKAKVILEMLQVLDSFDAAEQKLKKENKKDSGLELLHKQFQQALNKLGLKEIRACSEAFNHETMDCVMQGCDSDKKEDCVLEEFQKGYLLDGIVLRHAKVRVNKHQEKEKKEEQKAEAGKNPEEKTEKKKEN